MKRIVNYSIIVGGDVESVEAGVKAKLEDGWQPLGGLSQGSKDLLQALVKYEDSLNAQQEIPGD